MGYSSTTTKIQKVFTKLVKLSYMESLSINNNVASVGDFAIETNAQEDKGINIDTDVLKKQQSLKTGDYLLGFFSGGFFPAAFGFGKRTRTWTTADVRLSGWTIVKTWNQPQFNIIRYPIGIKEIQIAQFTYTNISELISVPWVSPKEINKITLHVNQFIPNEFPIGRYIKYYVKPNIKDLDFIEINPIGLNTAYNQDGTIIPRIINFNVEKPIGSSLEDRYIFTESPVKEVIFKAVFSRPNSTISGEDTSGLSPILKAYKLLMYPKNGL